MLLHADTTDTKQIKQIVPTATTSAISAPTTTRELRRLNVDELRRGRRRGQFDTH